MKSTIVWVGLCFSLFTACGGDETCTLQITSLNQFDTELPVNQTTELVGELGIVREEDGDTFTGEMVLRAPSGSTMTLSPAISISSTPRFSINITPTESGAHTFDLTITADGCESNPVSGSFTATN